MPSDCEKPRRSKGPENPVSPVRNHEKFFHAAHIPVSRHRNFFGGTECCTGPLAGAVDGDFAKWDCGGGVATGGAGGRGGSWSRASIGGGGRCGGNPNG